MRYDKVECEIDDLLSKDGLNPYERKLLSKIKRKMSKTRYRYRSTYKTLTSFIDDLHLEKKRSETEFHNLFVKYQNLLNEHQTQSKILKTALIFVALGNILGVIICRCLQ